MSFISNIFGGGNNNNAPSTPSSQTSFVREAPGIEERKLELMDIGRGVANKPIALPNINVAGSGLGSALEQQGLTAAGTTGIGAPTVNTGINSVLAAQQATLAANQQAGLGPNINQFLNPYQSYVTDEIGRQGQMMQNQLAAQAVNAGAFGGGREGVQQAELQNQTLQAMGRANASGFGTALGAAQRQQAQGIQTGLATGQQLGQLGQQLGQFGLGQQQMQQADISQLMGAGGVQRQLAQQALDATRQNTLQQQYEPYQRAEFLANLYAQGPKSQSGITMTTNPGTSPLAQSIGTGLGAFTAYQAGQQGS